MTEIPLIRAALQDRLEGLLATLNLSGSRRGGMIYPLNPMRNDKKEGSFVIYALMPKRGGFVDYAADVKGDVIDLIGYIVFKGAKDTSTRRKALNWAQKWLGMDSFPDQEIKRLKRQAQEAAMHAKCTEEEARRKRILRAFDLYNKALYPVRGTVVETYLHHRGIDLSAISRPEAGEMRYAPQLEYTPLQQRDHRGRVVKSGPLFPAMVYAMRDEWGHLRAAHCTFLQPDGSGKAPVEKPKLMYGVAKGAFMRLTKGIHNDPFLKEDAIPNDLVIAEGIETALSVALSMPHMRVWAAGSLANIGLVPVHYACVERIFVAKDKDIDKPQAQAAFEKAVACLRASGKLVVVVEPPFGKDFNDTLTGG